MPGDRRTARTTAVQARREHVDLLDETGERLGDPQEHEQVGHASDGVEDVVERRGEPWMSAVERAYEGRVQQPDDLVGELVARVLEIPDPRRVLLRMFEVERQGPGGRPRPRRRRAPRRSNRSKKASSRGMTWNGTRATPPSGSGAVRKVPALARRCPPDERR